MTDFVSAVISKTYKDIFASDVQCLDLHSGDSSIFRRTPKGVFYPRSVDDVKVIVKLAQTYKTSLSVRAGGTCMAGGSLTDDYIINMTKHMCAVKVNAYAKSVDVEMGAFYKDIDKELIPHHLMFPAYPSSKDICGIGGVIGNNASGEKSVRYGATIDNVYSVDVVLRDGNVYTFEDISDAKCRDLAKHKSVLGDIYSHAISLYDTYHDTYTKASGNVRKAASGYRLEKIYDENTKTWNIGKLFAGAQGTLGIVVGARLRLVDIPVFTRTVILPIRDMSELPAILSCIMSHNPEGVETFDIHTYEQAKKFLPNECLYVEHIFKHGVGLVVIAQFSEKTQTETDTVAQSVVEKLKKHVEGVYCNDSQLVESIWKIRRSSFKVMRDGTYDSPTKRAVPCIEDIIVPIESFDIFIPKLMTILKTHVTEYGFHGHIGDGSLRVIPIIDFAQKEKAILSIANLMWDVFALVKELKGNISADHSDGIIRTPFVREFYGNELYERVILGLKKAFDPHEVFNPGKKVDLGEGTSAWKKYIR